MTLQYQLAVIGLILYLVYEALKHKGDDKR